MKLELFKAHLNKRGAPIVTLTSRNADHFDNIFDARGLFKYIDFDCKINYTEKTKTGRCKEFNSVKCCCHGCLDSCGYLNMISANSLKKYARNFSVKTGFWRQGKGCILNHTMRSNTCLTYHCNYNTDRQFSRGLNQLKHIIERNENRILNLWRG